MDLTNNKQKVHEVIRQLEFDKQYFKFGIKNNFRHPDGFVRRIIDTELLAAAEFQNDQEKKTERLEEYLELQKGVKEYMDSSSLVFGNTPNEMFRNLYFSK